MKVIFWLVPTILILLILIQAGYSFYYFRKADGLIKVKYLEDVEIINESKPLLKILVLGDSIAAGVGATSFENSLVGRLVDYLSKDYSIKLTNKSLNGTRMKDLTSRQIPEDKQNLTLLVVSSNDLFHLTNLQDFDQAAKSGLEKISKSSEKTILIGPGKLYESGAIPLPLKIVYKTQAPKYVEILEKRTKETGVIYISPLDPSIQINKFSDYEAKDKFHLNDRGHEFWFNLVKKELDKIRVDI